MYWWKVNQNHPEIYKVSSSSYDLLSVVAWTNTPLGRDALVPNKGLEPLRHKTSEPKSDVSANSTNSANSARHTSIQAYLDNRITLTVVQATRASILH